jgi:hypothetical protein
MESKIKNNHWLWYALLILVFMTGLIIRISDLFDAPLDFHPTRQLHSALIARGIYYQTQDDFPEWKRDMAYNQWQAEGLIEPQIMEHLTAITYRIIGSEQVWIARLWAVLFWMVGGLFLFKLTEKIAGFSAGTFAVIFYMVWPYAAVASRAFQPEPLLVFSILAALWAFSNWLEKKSIPWAIITGLLCGFSIYVKSTAVFFLAPSIIAVLINDLGFKNALKDRQVWIIGVLSIVPYLAFLFYGVVIRGTLGEQFSFRFFPARWVDPLFYLHWILEMDGSLSIVFVLAAVLGITLFTKKKYFFLLTGYLIGYVLYGFVFSYHITTHDYYHLPLIIPVSIGIGILLGKIFKTSERNHNITKAIFTITLLVFIGLNTWQIRSSLSRLNYTEEIEKWEYIGESLGHESRVIGIFPNYGYRLSYWGWIVASSWTTSDDVVLRELAGQEVNLEENFSDRFLGFDYFVIADQDEYEKQDYLKEYFQSNSVEKIVVEDVIIYDLRSGK